MTSFDLAPLLRATIGFDSVPSLLDQLSSAEAPSKYPPYNIEKLDDNAYRLTMAVAGFSQDDIDIELAENQLSVVGSLNKKDAVDETTFLYRGIAERSFQRRFSLADHIKVRSASLENGLLHIDLEREVPEEQRPRKISIGKSPLAKKISSRIGSK